MKILCRYILAVSGFFGIANVYFCRINISMAIVPMLGESIKSKDSSGTSCITEFVNGTEERVEITYIPEFNWTPEERGLVLGAYYYGYTIFQIPSAWVAAKYGFKRSFGYSMLIASILTCLFPPMVRLNFYLGVIIRTVLGIFHSVAFPCLTGAWGIWAPPLERTKLNGIHVSGASAGTCIIFYLAGSIIESYGWASIFYVTGAISLFWVLTWFYFVYDSPEQHPRIDPEEREYIIQSIGQNRQRPDLKTPWKSILCSAPVWGIMLGHAASNWGNYTLNQQLPTYMTNVLGFDLKLTGLLSSLCYVLQWVICIVASWLTDFIRQKEIMSTIRIRKLNTIIGLWVTGICVVLAGYAGCNTHLAIVLLLLTAGLNTFTVPGCKSSMLDMAPAFSGIVFGFSNTISNIPGFVAPQVAGSILQNNTLPEWQAVFWLSACVHILGSVLFLFKGTDKLQDWAKVENNQVSDQKRIPGHEEIVTKL